MLENYEDDSNDLDRTRISNESANIHDDKQNNRLTDNAESFYIMLVKRNNENFPKYFEKRPIKMLINKKENGFTQIVWVLSS